MPQVLELTLPALDVHEVKARILEIIKGNVWTELQDASPVDQGYLRQHWRTESREEKGEVEIFNKTRYLPWIIRGTGIFGPHHEKIVPKVKKALAWRSKLGAGKTVRRSVKGMKPNDFVSPAVTKGLERSMDDLAAILGEGGPS
jgi:hypothetical protein